MGSMGEFWDMMMPEYPTGFAATAIPQLSAFSNTRGRELVR
jgi:hypothetical protein